MAAKEDGDRFARTLITSAIAATIGKLIQSEFIRSEKIYLVPIPSSISSRRRRGSDFMMDISRMLPQPLKQIAPQYQFEPLAALRIVRRVSDQSRLSRAERVRNLSGAFGVSTKESFKECGSLPIIVLDDVTTTGSTLREAFRALKERNLTVIGAATACASQRQLPIR